MACIFGSVNQWASIQAIAPEKFQRIANYEQEFQNTIQRNESVVQMAQRGKAYEETQNQGLVAIALDPDYTQPVFLENWTLPAGAFGENAGPI